MRKQLPLDTSNDVKNLFWVLIFIMMIVGFGLLVMGWIL